MRCHETIHFPTPLHVFAKVLQIFANIFVFHNRETGKLAGKNTNKAFGVNIVSPLLSLHIHSQKTSHCAVVYTDGAMDGNLLMRSRYCIRQGAVDAHCVKLGMNQYTSIYEPTVLPRLPTSTHTVFRRTLKVQDALTN